MYRSNGGTDCADNLITVCTDCHTHAAHQPGGVLYKWQKNGRKVKQYKEPPFMNALRKRMFDHYPQAIFTYGWQMTPARKALGLAKSHVNDAIAISGATKITEMPARAARIIQVRSKKRSLHEATPRKGRKEPNRTQKRSAKNTREKNGFHLGDTVIAGGRRGYITGFSGNNAYIKDMDGNYICQPKRVISSFACQTRRRSAATETGSLCRRGGAQFLPHFTPLGV